MGIGTYENGVFRLVASVRHSATATRLEEWRATMQHASQMLFDATQGQQRFGEILVANDSMGGAEADFWLFEPAGQSTSSHNFGVPGDHSNLMGDERSHPFIILHEFGHYAYHLHDEYAGPGPGPHECVGGTTANACIMEGSAFEGDRFDASGALVVGRINQFCVPSNHDPDGDTRQHANHHQSCWSNMVEKFPDLVMPASAPATQSLGNVPNLRWVVLTPQRRYVLVLDRSGSMAGAKLREAKVGGHWWVDASVNADLLGLVSFATTPSVDRHLAPLAVDGDRQPYHTAIDALAASGNTAIGDGLRAALDEVLALGTRAATQVMVLLTDGLQTTGELSEDVAPDLLAAGIRLYAVGTGAVVNDSLLSTITAQTGGRFVRIDPALSEADQSEVIRTTLEELSFETRDNGGVITSDELSSEPGSSVRRTVEIEHGSTRATFLLSRRHDKDVLTIRLRAPDGTVYTTDSQATGVRVIDGAQPYAALDIQSPLPGAWRVEVRSTRANRSSVASHLLVGSENPDIGTAFRAESPVYRAGAEVRLGLRVFAPFPVTRLSLKAELFPPGGAPVMLQFRDDGKRGDEEEDDGAYTCLISAPTTPGVYRVRAVAKARQGTAVFARADVPPDDRQRVRRSPVPSFTRVVETSFVVTKR